MSNTVEERIQKFLPDVGDIIFFCIVWLTVFTVPNFIFADGSSGWHILTGMNILATGHIPVRDFLSYTHLNAPWVAYEWLADLAMAALVRLGGLKLLAVVACSMIALLFLLLYERCRGEGCRVFPALIICIIGALTSSVHWLARPHLVTFFGIYLFATKLEDHYRGTISGARFFIPLICFMLLWCNCHPAFLMGFAITAIYLVCSLISWTVKASIDLLKYTPPAQSTQGIGLNAVAGMNEASSFLKQVSGQITLLIGLLAVTLINPYGPKLYQYIWHYLRGNAVIQATEEFGSPVFHGDLSAICLELLFALFVIALFISKKRLSLPRLLCCLAFGHLALSAMRHMPLFAIVVLPAIAQLFSQVKPLREIVGLSDHRTSTILPPAVGSAAPESSESPGSDNRPSLPWWQQILIRLGDIAEQFNQNERKSDAHVIPIAMFVSLSALAIFAKGNFGEHNVLTADFDQAKYPNHTLAILKSAEEHGELKPEAGFNYDNWGGYLAYKLNTRVFIDDRADFYGEPFYQEYGIVSQTLPGYEQILDKYKINWVLFPHESRLAAVLKNNSNKWTVAGEDKGSYLFKRKEKI